jgi:Neuraminidase (sialidase)
MRKFVLLFLLPTLLLGQNKPIKIFEGENAYHGPCEPSIVINPKNPNNVVAGSVLNYYHFSNDGGKTWQTDKLKSPYGVWGDPCLVADANGRTYYFHLSDPTGENWISEEILDRMVCQWSDDGGMSWSDGTYFGLAHPKDQDKEWAAVDFRTNHIACTWTQFDKYNSKDEADKSNILFAQSVDRGESWSEAIQINQFSGNCLDDDGTAEGAVPAYGPRGEIYVAWSLNYKIYFDYSLDGGKTWQENDVRVSRQPGGWTIDIPGMNRTNGMPVTACDVSEGPFKGAVYVCWGDTRNGQNNADIWITGSMDGGKTWNEPVRVNDDETERHQFLPWLSVDPITGYLYCVFYDRRNTTGDETEVYIAYSKDAGQTWVNEKISGEPFTPKAGAFMGDYNNISAFNGMVRPIWTELHEGKLSVWTALLNYE